MLDPTAEALATSEQRLPAAYSQGFAHIRVLTIINPDDPGPLGGSDVWAKTATDKGYTAPIDEMLRAD